MTPSNNRMPLTRSARYTTAKGLGHNMPGDDPDEIVLVNPAIDLIYTESSDRFFYWDAKESRFRDVAITD